MDMTDTSQRVLRDISLSRREQPLKDQSLNSQFQGATRTLEQPDLTTALEPIFAGHPLAMWIFDKKSLRFLTVNEAAIAWYGYTQEEFLKMRIPDVAASEDIPAILQAVASVDGTPRPALSCRHRLKNGRIVAVQMMTQLLMGTHQGVLTVVQDLTPRKMEEVKLQQQESSIYLRALTENCPLAIVVHDTDGRVLMCNPAFETLFQYRQEDIVGLQLDPLIVPEDRSAEAGEMTRTAVAGLGTQLTTQRQKKDGTLIDIEIHGVPLVINGVSAGAYGIYQDIRDRKRLEEDLRFAQKMHAIGRLAGGIAHDFNNIMGVIQGYSEYLLESVDPANPLRSSVEEIDKAARRAVMLTGQLLAFSRKQVLQPRVLDLNAILADMETMLRRVIGEDIQLVTLLGSDLGRVKADPTQLEQVIMNLAVNARDAMAGGGKLILETANVNFDYDFSDSGGDSEQISQVMLTVADTGAGMDTETQKHIFEPFFTTKEKGKGTGLGLATVYGIVKQSGGQIFATSQPGQGTTFTIYLPRIDEPASTSVLKAAKKETPHGTESILLVEDEDSVRALVRKFLEQCGYVVLEARNGAAAVEISQSFAGTIHVLLTDVIMPGINGCELSQHLSHLRPNMKVLFMSGYVADAKLPDEITDHRAQLINKPFSRHVLATKLRELIDN
jgi:two-component system cell cycle sensor histidine kinase/response regulator CckA